jgi:predicted component of viral defense system (DUF524 family)
VSNTILYAESDNISFEVRSSKAISRQNLAIENVGQKSLNRANYSFRNWIPDSIKILDESYKIEVGETVATLINKTPDQSSVQAIFFDQTPYTFEISLPKGTKSANIISPISEWSDVADWSSKSNSLILQTNFKNDLGEFELIWSWEDENGEFHYGSFVAEVFSTKLDIYTDFRAMIKEITDRFDFIKLDLLRKTRWGWSSDESIDSTAISWLILFQDVRESMEQSYNRLFKEHRKKLTTEITYVRAEKLRKLSPKQEERVANGLKESFDRRYRNEKQILTSDTPENRYMKYLLIHTIEQLNEIIETLKSDSRVAETFISTLYSWVDKFEELKSNPFWRGVGKFRGLKGESLILSQDPLYAAIRRSWILLQQGLSFVGNDFKGGIQNVAQLYEVWCLVKIEELIIASGEWKIETPPSEIAINDKSSYEELSSKSVKFEFINTNNENYTLHLLFQPIASKQEHKSIWENVHSYPVIQQPDIALKLLKSGKVKFTWLFDAKYRIDNNSAPEDAINQMHRYRDAIIFSTNEKELSRNSIGGYILYPGNELEPKRQQDSIEKVNIGSFSLKPHEDKSRWDGVSYKLKEMINKTITDLPKDNLLKEERTKYYVNNEPTTYDYFNRPK